MITGKFEFGAGPGQTPTPLPPQAAQAQAQTGHQVGLNELLSGGISSTPAPKGQVAVKRTQEAEQIIGLVEPKPAALGGGASTTMPTSAAPPPGSTAGQQNKDNCLVQ